MSNITEIYDVHGELLLDEIKTETWPDWDSNENPVARVGLNLMSETLYMANLAGCDLSGAMLNGADLVGADMRGAILTGASLHRAGLARAVFKRSDIPGLLSALRIIIEEDV